MKRCLDKRSNATKSGAAASKLAKCKYFKQLSFLHSKVSNKPTESNLTPVIEVEDTPSVQVSPSASTVTQSAPCPKNPPIMSTLAKDISSSVSGKNKAESGIIPYTPAKRSQELK